MTDYNNEYDNDYLEDLEIDPSEILDYSISEKLASLCGEEKAAFWRSFYQWLKLTLVSRPLAILTSTCQLATLTSCRPTLTSLASMTRSSRLNTNLKG